jgi:hypothetical protein
MRDFLTKSFAKDQNKFFNVSNSLHGIKKQQQDCINLIGKGIWEKNHDQSVFAMHD